MQPFVFEKRKPAWSHDHQQSFKFISKFAASTTTIPHLFPLLSSLMKHALALLPLGVLSSPFVSAHMGQAVMASSSLPHLPCHHHPPLPPPTLLTATSQPGSATTAVSPQRQSPKACHPIDAPPLIEGCGHPSLIGYISISILVLYPLYMINVYGTNPTTQKTV